MAKMLSVVNFRDAEAVERAARETGLPVQVGTKTWRSEEDGKTKVTIYTEDPKRDHAPFFAALKRLTAKNDPKGALTSDLDALRSQLPPGTEFEFDVTEGGYLHLERLDIPSERRGVGTEFLANVLAVADRHAIPAQLHADPTDEPGDPSTFELVRWYARFGFAVTGLSDEGWVAMERAPRPCRYGVASILEDYRAGRQNDLEREQFQALREELEAAGSPRFGR